MIKSVAIYARVSTQIQAEHGHSLSSQITACKEKAKELGAENIKEYVDDGYSGAYLERPALDNLRDALRDHLHDAVIIYDPDRMSRNLAHQLLLTEEFEKLGVKLVFISTEMQDTPEGKMLYQMRGVFASYEREKFRERSMRGKRSMARKGLIPQDSHVFGYDYDKENKKYIINETEAKVIRHIFDLYLSRKIGGTYQIANYLNDHNIPSPAGKRWHIESVRLVLSRRMYGGEYYFGRVYHTKKDAKKEVKLPRPKSEWIKIDCPAIVPLEDVEKAIYLMEENKRKRNSHFATNPLLLQGFVYCPKCGQKCTIVSGYKRKDGTRKRYYTCKRQRTENQCKAKMLDASILDELVWEAVSEICKSKTNLKAYIGKKALTQKPKITTQQKISEKLNSLMAERKTILSWFSNGLIEQKEATEKLQGIKEQEEELKRKLKEEVQKEKPTVFDIDGIYKEVNSCPVDFESKRKLLLSIIDKVYAARKNDLMLDFSIQIVFKPIE